MIDADKPRFVAALQRLCVVHERRIDGEGFETLCAAYWAALSRMDATVFERAVDKAVETGDRFPRPATLWAIAKEARRPAPAVDHFEATPVDPITAMASQAQLRWLWRRVTTLGVITEDSLRAISRERERLLAMHRALVADRDPEATAQRFERLFIEAADRLAVTA